ncbi:MAG: glycosyltransferase family 4 protein [Planctomycetota bacterium]|nr:glycosyltransferase family 4 protein [Planctomycetota bacterium]
MSDSAKLLFVSQQAPWPLDSGGNLRTYHLLRALQERYEVTLLATDAGGDAEARLREVASEVVLVPALTKERPLSRAVSLLKSLLTKDPVLFTHNKSAELERAVAEHLDSGAYSALHLNHLDTTPYARHASGVPVVVDTHNVLTEYAARRSEHEKSAFGRWLWSREARLLSAREPLELSLCQRVLACSERERKALLAQESALEVRVVPNGVAVDAITPVADPAANSPELVFVGDLAYGPNGDAAESFAREVLPLVRAEHPDALFRVVGRSPSQALKESVREGGVEVTGFVDDVRAELARARIFVCPIRYGSGTRLKLFEAFAAGLPVVSTRLGAEGIDCVDGEHLLLADTPEEQAAAISRLLADDELARSLGAAGRSLASERYDWPLIGRGLVEIYEELIAITSR